jgi:predicted  nucleic acid-binding Zn-ribbon protein
METLNQAIQHAEDDFSDVQYRMSDWFNSRNNYDSDMSDVRKMLDSIENFLGTMSSNKDFTAVISRLHQARDDLEKNQEKANRLKNSKYEIKSKSKELNSTLKEESEKDSDSDSSTGSSIDQLTDRYKVKYVLIQ